MQLQAQYIHFLFDKHGQYISTVWFVSKRMWWGHKQDNAQQHCAVIQAEMKEMQENTYNTNTVVAHTAMRLLLAFPYRAGAH